MHTAGVARPPLCTRYGHAASPGRPASTPRRFGAVPRLLLRRSERFMWSHFTDSKGISLLTQCFSGCRQRAQSPVQSRRCEQGLGERHHIHQDRQRPAVSGGVVGSVLTQDCRLTLQRQKVPDSSATARALDYSLRRWVALTRFVEDGQLPVDNNWIENQIRPIAIDRNNWLLPPACARASVRLP